MNTKARAKVIFRRVMGSTLQSSFHYACVKVAVFFVQFGTSLCECLLIFWRLLFPVSFFKPASRIFKSCLVRVGNVATCNDRIKGGFEV